MTGQKTIPPDPLLDSEGYPTSELLEYIRAYHPGAGQPILEFIEDVIEPAWWMPEFGFRLGRKYRGKRKLRLSTGGWSGNEDLISAILSNLWLKSLAMQYASWTRGGHYYFEIPCP